MPKVDRRGVGNMEADMGGEGVCLQPNVKDGVRKESGNGGGGVMLVGGAWFEGKKGRRQMG